MNALCLNLSDPVVKQYTKRYGVRGTYQIQLDHDGWLPDFNAYQLKQEAQVLPSQQAMNFLQSMVDTSQFDTKALSELGDTVPNGTEAAFYQDAFYFGNQISRGAVSEEAFHAVFQRLIPATKREQLLDMGRVFLAQHAKELGFSSVGSYYNQVVKNLSATYDPLNREERLNRLYEEALAKEFVRYQTYSKQAEWESSWKKKLTPILGAKTSSRLAQVISNLFRKLGALLGFYNSNRVLADTFFTKINTGAYQTAKITEAADTTTSPSTRIIRLLNGETVSVREAQQLMRNLGALVLQLQEHPSFSYLSESEQLDKAMELFSTQYSTTPGGTLLSDVLKPTQFDLDSFEDIANPEYYAIKSDLQGYLTELRSVSALLEEEFEDELGAGAGTNEFAGYDKEANEIGGFAGQSTWVKQYIARTGIPRLDSTGTPLTHKIDADGTLLELPILDIVDPQKVYTGLVRSLSNTDSVPLRLEKLLAYTDFSANSATNAFSRQLLLDLSPVSYQPTELLDTIKQRYGITDTVTTPNQLDQLLPGTLTGKQRAEILSKSFDDVTQRDTNVLRENLRNAIKSNTLDTYLTPGGKNILIRVLKGFDLWKRVMLNQRVDSSNGLSVLSDANTNRASRNLLAQWETNYEQAKTLPDTPIQVSSIDARLDLDAYGIPAGTLAQLDPADQSAHLEDVFNQEVAGQQAFFNQIGVQLPDVYLQYRLQDQLKRVYPDVYSAGTRASRLYELYSIPPQYLFTAGDISSVENYIKNPEFSPYTSDGSRKLSGGMVTRLRDLSEGASLFDENAVDSSYQNAEQKTVYNFQQKTYSLELFNWFQETGLSKLRNLHTTGNRTKLRTDPDGTVVYVKHDAWALQENRLLKQILSDEFSNLRSQVTGFTVDGTTQTELIGTADYAQSKPGAEANTGVTYGGMSPREFDQFNLNSLVSKYTVTTGNTIMSPVFLGNRETSKTGEYMVLPQINGIVANGVLTDTGKKLILAEIKKEFLRIQKAYSEINPTEAGVPAYSADLELAENYHTGKKLAAFTVRNPVALSVTVHAPTAGKDFRGLQFTDGLQGLLAGSWTTLPTNTSTEKNNLILAALAGYEFDKLESKLEKDLEAGMSKFLSDHYARFTEEGLWSNGNRTSLLNPKLSKEKIDNKLVSDLLNNISFAQIAYGDAALLYKNDGVDVFKRLKGLNAAIINFKIPFASPEQGIDTASTSMRVITVKEPGGASDVSGDNIDIADAQGYQSVQARRKHLYGAGRLTPLHVRVLDAIQEGKPVQGSLLSDLRDSHIMYNSEKTVGADGQQYKKLSESMLSKELTAVKVPITRELYEQYATLDKYGRTQHKPGSPEVSSYLNDRTGEREYYRWYPRQETDNLNQLRLKMDGFHVIDNQWVYRGAEHRVDLVTPLSASKTLNINVHKNVTEDKEPDWSTVSDRSIHEVDLNFYGLQTENPSGKKQIVDPTQMLEIIANEQGDIQVYHEGKLQSKTQVEPLWQEYLKSRDQTSYALARKVFETEDRSLDLSRFRESAFAAVVSSGKDKQTVGLFDPQNNLNLNLPLTRDQFISSFFNHFSKGVLSHKRAGDSLAHVSSFGHQVVKKIYRVKLDDDTTKLTWQVIRKDSPEYQQATQQKLKSLQGYQYKHTFKGNGSVTVKTRLEETEWFTKANELLEDAEAESTVAVYVLDSLRHLKPRLEETKPGSNIYKQTGYFSEALIPVHDDKIRELTPELKYSFGVRIPSQDKHSAMNVEWVDTMPAFMGSSIILPKEVVELSGSDFDIDKLYLTRTEGYWSRDERGRDQFIQYGKETTDQQRWESFTHYVLDHYKPIKRDLRKLLKEPAYQQLEQVVNLLQADQNNRSVDEENIPDWNPELLEQYFSGDLTTLQEQLRSLKNKAVETILKRYDLPGTAGEYLALSQQERDKLHVGAIQNRMLDLQQSFLANDITIDDADPTGGQYNQPANLDKYNELENEAENGVKLFGDGKLSKVSIHSQLAHSRVHQKNQVGKALIGIGVNGNLFMINAVKLGFTVQESFIPKLDDGYVHDGTYRARTHDKTGKPELSSKDKIIFGHPGIGKSYLRESRSDVLDFDTDFKPLLNKEFGIEPGFKALNKWRETNGDLWNVKIRDLWKRAVAQAKAENKLLIASDMILLREFENDFDKVVTISKDTFIKRAKQRNDYTEGSTESWKQNLDKTIGAVNPSKLISTEKYFSELFQSSDVRVFDVISTIITADTDEAKEAKNAFFKLGTDTQAAVIHMVGLGYSLLDALTFVNQPVIQQYVAKSEEIRRAKRAIGVLTEQEFKQANWSKQKIAHSILGDAFLQQEQDAVYSSADLRNALSSTSLSQPQQIQVLKDFMNLGEVNEYASNFVRFIKLKKGFGRELPAFDQLTEASAKLQDPEGDHPIDIYEKLSAQPQLGAQYLNLMENVLDDNLALQAQVFLRRHPLFVGIKNQLQGVLSMGTAENQSVLNKAVESFILSKLYQQDGNVLNPESVYTGNGDAEVFSILKRFQEKYAYTRTDSTGKVTEKGAFADNPIFSLLQPLTTRDGVSGLKLGTAVKLTPEQQENLLDAFRDLYTNPQQPVEINSSGIEEPVGKTLARELLNYHVVKDGFQYTMGNITRLFPPEVFSRISTQLDELQQVTDHSKTLINSWSGELLTALGRDISYQDKIKGVNKPGYKTEEGKLFKAKKVITYQTLDEKSTDTALSANLIIDISKLTVNESVNEIGGAAITFKFPTDDKQLLFPRFLRIRDTVTYYDEDIQDDVASSEQKVYELVSVLDADNKVTGLTQLTDQVYAPGVKARYVVVVPAGSKAVAPGTGLAQQYTGERKEEIQKLRERTAPGTATANYYTKPVEAVSQPKPRSLKGMIAPVVDEEEISTEQENEDLKVTQPCFKPE